MQFDLTQQYLSNLKRNLKTDDQAALRKGMEELHPADIAEILDELNKDEGRALFSILEEEIAADVLVELEEDVRENLLSSLSSKEIAYQVIDNIESDDAADVIAELPDEVQEEIIKLIEDPEQASDIADLLNYDENTAGGLMAKELIAVNKNWAVLKCVKEMRHQAEIIDDVYAVYVVDNQAKLLGILSLNKLLITPTDTKIEDVYEQNAISVHVETNAEEVANIMDKYDLVVLPVIDNNGTLVGKITIDDVVDVIKEEAEKDYQMASGITDDVESSDKAWVLSKARLPWLLIGLIGGIFGAQIIGLYEHDIQIYPEMAFFIPLIAAMGGNVGVQSSALIVQGLANNTLGVESITSKLIKELGVALINGLICSAVILIYNLVFSDSLALSLTVSVALLSVIIFAGLFGTLIPLLLDRVDVDAALATGPFITTINDILGLVVYFIIGRLMYGVI
ncbi:MAG TPA: magnesium transporter [Flavobacteriales bacterium]|nr:magnesium transporter [Flavobacteriales bacterium]